MTPDQERKVDELGVGVGEVNTQLADIRRRARRRSAIQYVAIALALLVGVSGIVVAHRAETELHVSQARNAAARVESCKGSNHDKIAGAHKDIRLSHDTVLALIHGAKHPVEAHAAAHAFNAKHDALIRASYKHRDCSPAGIARYLGIPKAR